jgi:uncharacterized Zn-finger protein
MKTATHFAFEIVSTRNAEVACDGGSPINGHPLVYLHIRPEEGEVVCPYCSRTFRLEQSA